VHTSWKKSSILSIAPAATSHTTQQASTDRVLKGKSIPPTHTKHKLRHTAIGDRGRFGAFAPPPPCLRNSQTVHIQRAQTHRELIRECGGLTLTADVRSPKISRKTQTSSPTLEGLRDASVGLTHPTNYKLRHSQMG